MNGIIEFIPAITVYGISDAVREAISEMLIDGTLTEKLDSREQFAKIASRYTIENITTINKVSLSKIVKDILYEDKHKNDVVITVLEDTNPEEQKSTPKTNFFEVDTGDTCK